MLEIRTVVTTKFDKVCFTERSLLKLGARSKDIIYFFCGSNVSKV